MHAALVLWTLRVEAWGLTTSSRPLVPARRHAHPAFAGEATRRFGFSSALRGLLRADADVILLGELDDPETARIALDAVHAGRRILSAINARSAMEGLARLLDIARDARAVGDSLRAIVSQRLVRRLCTECREASPATLAERDELSRACRNVQVDSLLRGVRANLTFWRKRGCKACGGSGQPATRALTRCSWSTRSSPARSPAHVAA